MVALLAINQLSYAQNIFPATGNVGIGTTSPSYPLFIIANQNSNIVNLTSTGTGNSAIEYFVASGAKSFIGQANGPWFGMSSPSVYESNQNIVITPVLNDATKGITLLTTGFMGIGTATPKETLSVNGNIRSKQVKVETANWPDYVFKKEYNLPSLSEVKTYIDQNYHLPEMPSEAEVIKNGINLGEMVKLQTKKIEELTLYLIDKDKQNKEKDAKLQSQQKQIEDQNKAIQSLQQQMDQITKKLNN